MSHPSMGVEEELLLVSASGRPLPRSKAVAADAEGIDVELELTRAQVEINSPVCTSSGELRRELTRMRSKLAEAAAEEGARLLAIAAPPHGEAAQLVTKKARYQEMAARYGLLAREQAVCGCHVHIDVPDKEGAIRVSNHLRPWLPTLLALTANSAIYLGTDTGFSSWRSIMWSRWPCSGQPPYFESAEHYDALVAMQLATGSIMDERMVYWDVRPSTHLPTVEVRVSDVPLTVDETVLLATLVRALAMTALDDGGLGPKLEPEVLRAAYWLAARDGLSNDGLDVFKARPIPMTELLGSLERHVAPALQELGETDMVAETLQRVLKEGNGAVKQRQAFQAGEDIVSLTEVKL
ncbi:glutamate--cysteine ligase [Kribbella sancticallisti]|uniref:Putative glutamate--cysteine ligase 2 n=1 Tax=Kribbella sancticallisti TaxID=460087 RepID=A0ABP4PMT2_9ACTN